MCDKEHRDYLRKIRLNKLLVHMVQLLIIIVFIFLWEYLSSNGIIIVDNKNLDDFWKNAKKCLFYPIMIFGFMLT